MSVRSSFTLRDSIHGDIDFARVYPVWSRFVLPGDVWKISSSLLIRFMPMTTPPLTRDDVRVRFFFVPLRLVEEDTELIITGSKNGKFDPNRVIPKFSDIFQSVQACGHSNAFTNDFGSLSDWIYGLPITPSGTTWTLDSFAGQASAPAAYVLKSFSRCLFDYYRDENFSQYDDFDSFVTADLRSAFSPVGSNGSFPNNFFTNLRKDGYITSSLPWQLKGVAPTINLSPVQGGITFGANPIAAVSQSSLAVPLGGNNAINSGGSPFVSNGDATNNIPRANQNLLDYLNSGTLNFTSGGFNMAQFREMAAQTRIFERLARTGSRYTEYLRANFGTAPDDGTLQRAQYLGGYKMPIVTTEVLQTAEGDNPVGTMRGHGITSGGDRIHTAHFREFGIVLAMLDVRPHLEWTQGVDREKTYKSRWDFYNPSFANLSEQQVRNGEVYFSNDGKNDDPFGYVPYGQELRTSRTRMAGQMRGNLANWNQAITFGSRPSLNQAFLKATNYDSSWKRPFVVTSGANPMILDFQVLSKVVRPMVRNAIPGLVDHR